MMQHISSYMGPVLANARSLRPDDVRNFEEVAQAPVRSR
jgi:hypothetical protein